ncbi:MAG: fasciclin domain-containing protein [Planctomycetota bacterium]
MKSHLTPMACHPRGLRAALFLFLSLLAACSSSDDGPTTQAPPTGDPESNSLLDRARSAGFGQFVALASASSFADRLRGEDSTHPGDLTVFAPSDASFALLPPGEIQALFEPGAEADLDAFVGYHLAEGSIDLATLGGLPQLGMLAGGDAFVDIAGDATVVNDARIETLDDEADNGLLFGISRPLEAPRPILETLERRGFTTLLELVDLAGLSGSLAGGQWTFLAPNEDAFSALSAAELDDLRDPAQQAALQARLELHLTAGVARIGDRLAAHHAENLGGSYLFFGPNGDGAPSVNGTRLEAVNVRCTDGIVHVLPTLSEELPTVGELMAPQGLATLGSLMFAGGLTQDLDDLAPLTLFGPTNLALEFGLAPGVLDDLVDPANLPQLQAFLRTHMVTLPASYESLDPGTALTAISGESIQVTESFGQTTLNGAIQLSVRNVYARNGVLHVIDGVLDDGE